MALGIGEIPAEHGAVGGTHSSAERSKKSSAKQVQTMCKSEEAYPSMDPANVLREATELMMNQAFRLIREMSFPSKELLISLCVVISLRIDHLGGSNQL